jgi:iron complex outermembrane receptor protein
MSKTRYTYASLAAVIAALSASGALAQQAAAEPNAPDEIVVTATKRNESLVKVPISVSVFTSADIAAEGITRPADFLTGTPNVTFLEDNAGESYINIRGQTSVRNSDPNVAIVIDGVTLSSVKPFNQDLFDLKQIEVLKGPQSALYGRNAAAGAIVITTRLPGDKLEGQVVAARGNFNTTRANASVSGPLTDTLGFSVAGSFRDTDGPFTNITSGEKVQRFQNASGRARLVYDNHDGLTADLKLTAHSSKGGGSAYNAQVAIGVPVAGFTGTVLDANNADLPFVSNVTGAFDEDFFDATLKLEYDMGFAKLTSITSYNRLNQYFGSDSPPYVPPEEDFFPPFPTVQQYTYKDTNLSQELRLTSPGDQRFRWQVGFYILRFERDQTSKISQDNLGTLPANRDEVEPAGSAFPTLSFSKPLYRTTSFAPFASVQYDITDALHINLAGRYDTEKRSISEVAPTDINPLTGVSYNNCVALTGASIDECNDSRTFTQFEPKASISYDVSSNASVYASYGKGFKSGGFNPIGSREALIDAAESVGLPASSVYVQDGYDKEVSTSYEIGAKMRLFDRRLSINAAVFKTDISGAQQFEFYPSVGLQTTISIDKVELKGFDIDFDAQLPGGFRVFGGYGYTDGVVKEFAGNPAFNGNRSPGAFKYTLSLGATTTIDLGGDLSLVPRVEYNRFGSIWWDVANTAGTQRDALDLVKARLSLKSGKGWEISAYGDNLTNEKYFQEVVPLLGFFTVNYRGPTRSYGLEARVNF